MQPFLGRDLENNNGNYDDCEDEDKRGNSEVDAELTLIFARWRL